MARLDLNRQTASTFRQRIQGIENDAQRQWGTMGPEKLIRHVTYLIEISLGEKHAEKIFVPVPSILLWYVFFAWFTQWPKGKFQAPPSFLPPEEGNLEDARAACMTAIERFVDQLELTPGQRGYSPLLGNIPLTKWARVHGIHLDHHLRQYGL